MTAQAEQRIDEGVEEAIEQPFDSSQTFPSPDEVSVAERPPIDDDPATGVWVSLRLEDQLCYALYAATNEVVRAYRPLLAQLNLTYPQYLLLMALWENNRQTISQLARTLRLPPHGLLPVITRLEQAGLLRRTRDSADRRVVRLSLTPSGAALEQHAARVQHQVACRTRLTPAALKELRTRLHHLVEELAGDLPAQPAGSTPS